MRYHFLCQTPSIPRKGTETVHDLSHRCSLILGQTPSIPRKGTETDYAGTYFVSSLSQTPSIPRKGTETLLLNMLDPTLCRVRHPQFPARGRKLDPEEKDGDWNIMSDTLNSPQGDGNAINTYQLASISCIASDTLNSPQGDGNAASRWWSHPAGACVRHPQFPARGRKQFLLIFIIELVLSQTPSIPRKGTETNRVLVVIDSYIQGQTPSIPRKGTETLYGYVQVLND